MSRRNEPGMPILGHPEADPFPWPILAPHERRAFLNHSQSLATLRRRGGLSPCELVAILEGRRYERIHPADALARLVEIAAACGHSWEVA